MFSTTTKLAIFAAAILLGVAQPAQAVCSSGQMAVGTMFDEEFTGPSQTFNIYGGFLMTNGCSLISESVETQDSNQMCKGGYGGGASVTCNSSNQSVHPHLFF
ncbi:hypothetical protein EW026_g7061 [Hermanssonia centrifuga]|uniref:Uncharacterized protein n=1 Tax=Hermanssonia centrifuga TaxID=98765 RepID=A0A4S4K980_9APHY|nr:hypothetical protein EW026_g7061 [Hermanssonia centrifuga]